MTIKPLFELAPGWWLGRDHNQWILLRQRNLRTQRGWKPEAFVGSSRAVLQRVLLEKGITPVPEAERKMDALPFSFVRSKTQTRKNG